jgi:hypothetical protein
MIGAGLAHAAVYNGPRFTDDESGYGVTTCDKTGRVVGIRVGIKGSFNALKLVPALQSMWDGIVHDMTPEDLAGTGPERYLPFQLQAISSQHLNHASTTIELRPAQPEGDHSLIWLIDRPHFTGEPCPRP